MERQRSSKASYAGSSPACGAILKHTRLSYKLSMGKHTAVEKSDECVLIWAFGEMDIISVFETEGKGSIPLEPAKNILSC